MAPVVRHFINMNLPSADSGTSAASMSTDVGGWNTSTIGGAWPGDSGVYVRATVVGAVE